MPERIQRKRTAGWRKPEGAIYVGRPTKWGSPFVVGALADRRYMGLVEQIVIEDRAHSVRLYRDWLANPATCFMTGFYAIHPRLLDLSELAGHDLACWCPLDQPCHADVLLEIANA
ncbi:DUF4326 domain-containing protein [Mycobacteroides abscessus]|uniref:DUF4326 domain-containing protein n=1 Tax=Mycobacteroides abscessus subsp. massiliense TaxID=1962118 RepID=A0A1T8PBV7_9MYCO|nr:DUF4326 domain-containing protein [Mycobacteroides abscessus]SKM29003.1 Uncharacterised protein [Mycobacteroides abscessus subsp. massiliense]SKT32272.1 Uncharacterised protein [Mycobacteroides abscessus subsp. massiliense]SKT69362.1 Uncharacterised protein [Mycobacteroides abscessus subsp. massiliense]SKX08694.1 Uncharacterised protein [Mycobacteroides abscessus subsp. massiliense]